MTAEEWDPPEPWTPPDLDIAGILRTIRSRYKCSQRQLAALAGLPPSRVSAIESGRATADVTTLQRLLAVFGAGLMVFDEFGLGVDPHRDDGLRDRAGRRYPAHLDVREVGPNGHGWWGRATISPWVRPQPEHTFSMSPAQAYPRFDEAGELSNEAREPE